MGLVADFHDLLQKWLDCPKWCLAQALRWRFHPGSQGQAFQKQQPASSDFMYSDPCFSISKNQNKTTRFVEKIQVWVSTLQNHRLALKLCPEQDVNECSALCQSCLAAMGATGTAGRGSSSSEVAKPVRAGQQQLTHRHGVK